MSFGQGLLLLVGLLVAMWFFNIWLPHRLHVIKIARKYGWPSEKRAAIERLFLDGTLTSVGYIGGTFNPNQEFQLIIVGPFGSFVRKGTGDTLCTDDTSAPLPSQVAEAFSGYMDAASDVIWLLWYLPFLEKLQQAVGRHCKVGGDMPQSLAIVVA